MLPTITNGNQNVAASSESITIIDYSEAAVPVDATIGQETDWFAPLLVRGIAEDTYFVEVVIGGLPGMARFRVTSLRGDNLASTQVESVTNDESGETEHRLALGNTLASLVLPDGVTLTPEMRWTIPARAKVTVNTPVASGAYFRFGKLPAIGKPFTDDAVEFCFGFFRSEKSEIDVFPIDPDKCFSGCFVMEIVGGTFWSGHV